MKKSTPKLKLNLNRETLRVLENLHLVVAAEEDGGSATVRYSNCGSCNTGAASA